MTRDEIEAACLAADLLSAADGPNAWTDSRVTVSLGTARSRSVVRVYVEMKVCTAQIDLSTQPVGLLDHAIREARAAAGSEGIY